MFFSRAADILAYPWCTGWRSTAEWDGGFMNEGVFSAEIFWGGPGVTWFLLSIADGVSETTSSGHEIRDTVLVKDFQKISTLTLQRSEMK